MELCLGTVQFGMDYGIFNTKKKDEEYCIKCLDYAVEHGIRAIDTATAYGTAEEIVGKFLKKNTINREELFVSTKLSPNILDTVPAEEFELVIEENLRKSLQILETDYVDSYFLHSSRYAFNSQILIALEHVKNLGLARQVGVSVYYPDEAIACIENPRVDCIQLPYSIFDHRMKEKGIFKSRNFDKCKMDVRTAFIKGLIRLKSEEVPEHLSKAVPILKNLDETCEKYGYSRIELAMGYIKKIDRVNHLVFGVRTIEQLQEDIDAFNKTIPNEIFDEIDEKFKNMDIDIVVPSLWKK